MKTFFVLFFLLGLTSCIKPTGPGIIVTTGDLTATITQQLSPEVIVGEANSSHLNVTFKFGSKTKASPPKDYTVAAFSDPDCSRPSDGSLTYNATKTDTTLSLENLKYSKAQDLFIGIYGPKLKLVCSSKVSVFSSEPVYFTITSGNNQTIDLNQESPAPFVVKIMDGNNNPVKNARIKVGQEYSSPSDSNGSSLIYFNSGLVAGSVSFTAELYFKNVLTHSESFYANVKPGAPASISIDYQDSPSVVQVFTPSDPIYLVVKDFYGNTIMPDSVSPKFTIDVEAFSDSNCYNSLGSPDSETSIINPALDSSDSTTWLTLSFYEFDTAGDRYLKYTAYDNNNQPVGSVCSGIINITP